MEKNTRKDLIDSAFDEIYSKEHEVSIHWTSIPGVRKRIESLLGSHQLIISDKDNTAIDFNEYIKK